jgi:hypothetical protein
VPRRPKWFRGCVSSLSVLVAQALVDRRDLLHPPRPLEVIEGHHGLERPVEVVRHEGYLLVERVEGVA